jgi:hypothetical protein
MTDCTYNTARLPKNNVISDIVFYIFERRRIIFISFGVAATCLSLFAIQ